jgi:flagellar FliL protein
MSDAKKGDGKAGDAPAAPADKGGGGSKLLPVMIGVNSLLLVGVMVFLVLQMQKQQAAMTAAIAEIAHSGGGAKAGGGEEHGGGAKEPAKEEPREEPKEEPKGEGKSEGGEGEGKKEGKGGGGGAVMVKLPDFVVHLRNPDADRYARMSFDVEVFADSDKDRVNGALPRIRDAFISYLSDRTLEDLRGSEGLSRTKESLQTILRQTCPDARIRALYISDFVVQ